MILSCNKKIRFIPLKHAGGKSLIDKIDILLKMPNNLIKIHKYCNQSDWIQFRAPSNLGIYVLPYLSYFCSKNRWVKYAGSWGKKDGSFFYRLQKEWLSNNIQKCRVTINGEWVNQKKHCLSFENPCLTNNELHFGKIISEKKTYKNKRLQINLALNYGSKTELINAFKELKKNREIISEKNLKKYLQTKNIPDPEILIRTGNTKRLSNFLLWQLAYSEIFFEKKLWPDFDEKDYNKIIKKFRNIKRNFGKI